MTENPSNNGTTKPSNQTNIEKSQISTTASTTNRNYMNFFQKVVKEKNHKSPRNNSKSKISAKRYQSPSNCNTMRVKKPVQNDDSTHQNQPPV